MKLFQIVLVNLCAISCVVVASSPSSTEEKQHVKKRGVLNIGFNGGLGLPLHNGYSYSIPSAFGYPARPLLGHGVLKVPQIYKPVVAPSLIPLAQPLRPSHYALHHGGATVTSFSANYPRFPFYAQKPILHVQPLPATIAKPIIPINNFHTPTIPHQRPIIPLDLPFLHKSPPVLFSGKPILPSPLIPTFSAGPIPGANPILPAGVLPIHPQILSTGFPSENFPSHNVHSFASIPINIGSTIATPTAFLPPRPTFGTVAGNDHPWKPVIVSTSRPIGPTLSTGSAQRPTSLDTVHPSYLPPSVDHHFHNQGHGHDQHHIFIGSTAPSQLDDFGHHQDHNHHHHHQSQGSSTFTGHQSYGLPSKNDGDFIGPSSYEAELAGQHQYHEGYP